MLREFTIDETCDAKGLLGDVTNELKKAFEGIPFVTHRVKISVRDLEAGNIGLEISVNGWTRCFGPEEYILMRKKMAQEIRETFGSG